MDYCVSSHTASNGYGPIVAGEKNVRAGLELGYTWYNIFNSSSFEGGPHPTSRLQMFIWHAFSLLINQI